MTTDLKAKLELRSSFLWRVGAAAGGMASTLLLTVVAVRSLSHQEAATFFAILAALSFGSKIGCLGMGPNVIRLVAAESDAGERRKIAGTHLRAAFVLSGLTAPLIALIGCNGLFGIRYSCQRSPDNGPHNHRVGAVMISDIFAADGRVRASVATMHYVRSSLRCRSWPSWFTRSNDRRCWPCLQHISPSHAVQLTVAFGRRTVGRLLGFTGVYRPCARQSRKDPADLAWIWRSS